MGRGRKKLLPLSFVLFLYLADSSRPVDTLTHSSHVPSLPPSLPPSLFSQSMQLSSLGRLTHERHFNTRKFKREEMYIPGEDLGERREGGREGRREGV